MKKYKKKRPIICYQYPVNSSNRILSSDTPIFSSKSLIAFTIVGGPDI